MTKPELKILILTDGKIGDLMQCRGVASALTSATRISETVVTPGWLTSLPLPYMPLSAVDRQSTLMSTDADIIIASGRRTVPYMRALKKRRGRKCFAVFLKDPTMHHDVADMIWAPQHDQLSKPNSISTETSPHAFTAEKLDAARKTAAIRFAEFASPNVGLILGGNTKSVSWSEGSRQRLMSALQLLPTGTNVLVTSSRRTPQSLLKSVQQSLEPYDSTLWSGEESGGANPYLEMLAWCDRLIVTGDSHNMVSEALVCGCPVHVFRPDDLHKKMHRFLDALEAADLVQDISQGFDKQMGTPINATPLICAEIMKRYVADSGR
ncbi:MAG: nucleoside-diphosphate sugar epimerase [Rhizobiaceae bacterium]|nr:nucleoside-diphosphate sugar epimerase [Rhizobiaceae bacterium]